MPYPALIIVVPLLAALLVVIAGWVNPRLCFPLALIALVVGLYAAVGLFLQVQAQHLVQYRLGGWPPPIGIEYRVDHLNALVLVVIFAVAVLNLISAWKKHPQQFPGKTGGGFGLYLLFVTGLAGITVTGDAFNLYVLLEITALTGYALIGMGKGHAPLAALNYVLLGTVGASLYLLGIGYVYLLTGSLNMADLAGLLPGVYSSPGILFAFLLCLVGLFIKMAFFPLHIWLPNAYSYTPSAFSGLIAALTTKVMIYVMIRISITVFTKDYIFASPALSQVLVWLAVIAIVCGSILALAQPRLTRMLTYIIIAEVGYMVGGFWLGNADGFKGAMLHIVNDAAMTLCLFLVTGNILHRYGNDRFSDLKGIFATMPVTMFAFVIGALSLIGVPPTCGFFSKWYLIKGGISAGHFGYVAALLFSSLINLILFFKIIEIGFFEKAARGPSPDPAKTAGTSSTETPLSMLTPLLITALTLIGLGLATRPLITQVIQPAMPY